MLHLDRIIIIGSRKPTLDAILDHVVAATVNSAANSASSVCSCSSSKPSTNSTLSDNYNQSQLLLPVVDRVSTASTSGSGSTTLTRSDFSATTQKQSSYDSVIEFISHSSAKNDNPFPIFNRIGAARLVETAHLQDLPAVTMETESVSTRTSREFDAVTVISGDEVGRLISDAVFNADDFLLDSNATVYDNVTRVTF